MQSLGNHTIKVRSTDILQKLNWIPIENILMKRETVMTFKALTGRLPDYLQDLFRKSENGEFKLLVNTSNGNARQRKILRNRAMDLLF